MILLISYILKLVSHIQPPRMEEVLNIVWNNVSNLSSDDLDKLDYMVKPHEQLVLVSFTPHNASTPSLSTS
jgi:hypothetical protein